MGDTLIRAQASEDLLLELGFLRMPDTAYILDAIALPAMIFTMINVYLHEVLDQWFDREVEPRLRGHAFMVRFADEALLALARQDDVRRVMEVPPKRFERFGLTLHPEKTRLVDLRSPARTGGTSGSQRERSFDLLGFTHYWGRSRTGLWVVQRKTAKARFRRAVWQSGDLCQRSRHLPVAQQQRALRRKLRGHDAYYGISGNARALSRFRHEAQRRCHKWLNGRSRAARLNWVACARLLNRYPLPPARVVHSV